MIDLVKGSHYFAIKCPKTGKVLAIERDTSDGWATFTKPEVTADCHHCQSTHRSFLHDGPE